MKKILITAILGFTVLESTAQNDIDALRYSGKKFGSTAKTMATAGAVGALGADVSVSSVNPAGLAQFRKGEFTFSTGFINNRNTSQYLGTQVTDNTFKMNVSNLGLVFCGNSNTKKGEKGWKNSTFSMSLGRVADFNRVVSYEGLNTQTSLMDYFAERANGYTVNQIRATDDDFDNGFASRTTMAWEAYLIDSVGDRTYAANASPIFHNIQQKGLVEQSGGMYEYNMAFAGNYSDILYLGAGLTYTNVKFRQQISHNEVNDPRNKGNYVVYNFNYSENLRTTGGGFSGQLGLIVRPADYFRFGLSMQTPSILKLDDSYDFGLSSALNNGNNFNFKSKDGNFSYRIITPARFTASAAAILGKYGFISADLESVDYSSMRLRSEDGNYTSAMETANSVIRQKYTNAVNYRLGAELVSSNFRFRGGYASYGSPLLDGGTNQQNGYITGGFGIKEKEWALDFALVHATGKDVYQPYTLNDTSRPAVYSNNTFNANTVVMTFTSKF